MFTLKKMSSTSSRASSRRSSTNSNLRASTSSIGSRTGRKSLQPQPQPEENFDDLKGLSLDKLREMKRKAIQDLKFDESARITKYMNGSNVDQTKDFAETLKNELCRIVDDLLRGYDQFEKEKRYQAITEEMDIRQKKQQTFEKLMKDFEENVTGIEIERQIDIAFEQTRTVGQQQALEAKARKHAFNDEFEEAKLVLAEANEVGNNERMRRTQLVNDKYDKLIENAELQLQTDLDTLEKRLEAEISKCWGKYNNLIAQQQKVVSAQIIQAPQKLLTKKMSTESTKNPTELKSQEKKRQDNAKFKSAAKDTLQKLENFLIAKLQDEERTFVFNQTVKT